MTSHLHLFEIAESSHRILNPISLDKLVLVGEIVGVGPSTRILDVACGKAEMLVQWSSRLGCSGHGVDVSEVYLQAAAARAEELGVADRLTFSREDAEEFVTDERFDVVSCIGASWFAGGVEQSLEMMQAWAAPGATLLLGECYWAKDPTPAASAVFGQGFRTLAGTFARFESAGLDVVEMVLADGDSWDRYCAAQWKNLYDWIVAHPIDPDVDRAKERLVTDRRNYSAIQREYLGWGIFVLKPALS